MLVAVLLALADGNPHSYLHVTRPEIDMPAETDPHSPGQYRANGTLRNQPGFYEAYSVKQGDKMYLAPNERVIIW